jgi:hypothetical protein
MPWQTVTTIGIYGSDVRFTKGTGCSATTLAMFDLMVPCLLVVVTTVQCVSAMKADLTSLDNLLLSEGFKAE